MNTTIYTAVKYDWDGVANEFVVKEQVGYEYHGPILYAKKALKKLSKSFLGKIVMAVAAYYTGGLLAGAMGVTSTGVAAGSFAAQLGISSAAAGNALAYGLTGAVAGGITGGAKGALLGGLAGGLGGYYSGGGFDSLGSGSGSVGTANLAPEAAGVGGVGTGGELGFNGLGVPANATPAASAVTTGGAEVGLNYGGISPEEAAGATYDTASSGSGFQNAATSGSTGVSGSLDSAILDTGAQSVPATSRIGNFEWNATGAQGDMSVAPGVDVSSGTNFAATAANSISGGGGFLDGVNFKGMGLELGKAALGSALNPKPDMGAYNDYLDSMTQSNKDVTAFNKDMAGKKAAIGDQLTTDAIAMNPDYYAEQRRRGQAFADADSWANQKAGLELRGTNAQGIQAEQNRNDLFSSLRQGTAYDQGWQTGMASRNATFSTAGSMYGQLGYPTDNVGAGYGNQYNQWSQNNNATGKLIEKVADAGQSKNTGTQKTRDNVYDMGVTG